ncbi:fibrobacter succinogenes major paralogous domain-containing protein [Sphingorhabdus sp.]|uniref:fibrobacter succinogenes major paralogous domain-containing protein n=1 Tax=Sphingorhabdus sp. TaxID=1902408 RepID=UPI003983A328
MYNFTGIARIAAAPFLLSSGAAIEAPSEKLSEQSNSTRLIQSVTIGTQTWMKENYAGTSFRNGDPIPRVADASSWAEAGRSDTAAYTTYANQVTPPKNWGLLYNFAAINDARGICPEGWRVPNNRDWQALEVFLGGGSQATAALKATQGWSGTTGGANTSGFGALPAGWRTQDGIFYLAGRIGYFWTRDLSPDGTVLSHMVFDVDRPIFRIGYNPGMGQSLRCIAN